ncbi:MAG: DUF1127 domain-containing protein [Sulfitobacter sp.]
MRIVLPLFRAPSYAQCQHGCVSDRICAPAPRTGPSVLQRIVQITALWRSRRALAALTEDQLADVGLSASEAQAEAERPVWDAPAAWRR